MDTVVKSGEHNRILMCSATHEPSRPKESEDKQPRSEGPNVALLLLYSLRSYRDDFTSVQSSSRSKGILSSGDAANGARLFEDGIATRPLQLYSDDYSEGRITS